MSLPVLVLTAGLGTRLRPLTYRRAKAAALVNGEPLACRVVRWLAGAGYDNLVLNLHHHPETITTLLGDGAAFGVRIRYSWENPVLGSAGGPRHALPLLSDGGHRRFLLVNGDTLTDVDVGALLARHESSGARVTMSVIPNPRPEQYGGVRVGPEGFVEGFSRPGTAGPSFHFVGVQVAEREVFAGLEDGVPHESVNSLYPRMIAGNSRAVAAFVTDARFRDIGTPADCLATSLELAREEGDRLVSDRSRIAPDAVIERTAIWDDVVVGTAASLHECIVADGAVIPPGSRYARAAIVRADGRPPDAGERIEGSLLVKPL
jgi:NDP-sugar pyrophosphorylase family protein